ncbi:endoribonuclease Dicer homolog 2-like protein [Tanacetum coccineum]
MQCSVWGLSDVGLTISQESVRGLVQLVIMANNNGDGSSGSNSDVSIDDQHQFSNARSYQIEALDQAIKLITNYDVVRHQNSDGAAQLPLDTWNELHCEKLKGQAQQGFIGKQIKALESVMHSKVLHDSEVYIGPALEMIKRDLSMLRERHESKIQNSNLSESSTESAIRRLSRLITEFGFFARVARGGTFARGFRKDATTYSLLHTCWMALWMNCDAYICGVVFTAMYSKAYFVVNPKLFGWKTEYTAGNNSPVPQSRGVQNKIVDEFREGKVNIIVATSILEEGLDGGSSIRVEVSASTSKEGVQRNCIKASSDCASPLQSLTQIPVISIGYASSRDTFTCLELRCTTRINTNSQMSFFMALLLPISKPSI